MRYCCFLIIIFSMLFMMSSCKGSPGDSDSEESSCSVCSSPAGIGSEYCEAHKCEECNLEKDENDRFCEAHKCPECGELKDETAEYCELHACPECGGLKEEDAEYCEDCRGSGGSGSLYTTLDDCAKALNVSEKELSAYERDFSVNRYDRISFEMCELFSNYMQEIRELKGGMDRLDREIANGYIRKIKKITLGGNLCQTIIVNKQNVNYLLLVRGDSECTMGTAQFNENLDDWQLVYIHQDPSKQEFKGHYMRILERGGSESQLTSMMDTYCGF